MKFLYPEPAAQGGPASFVAKDGTAVDLLNPLVPTADGGTALTRLIAYAVIFKVLG